MTIGEKIKYFRMKKKITQAQLSELSGVHPVAIRKYETNTRVPQETQISKISDALGINAIALNDTDEKFKFSTAGNIVSVLMHLFDTGVFKLSWQDNGVNPPMISSVKIVLNPVFSSFLSIINTKDNSETNLEDIYFKVTKKNMFTDLLSYYVNKQSLEADAAKGKNEENDPFFKSLKELLETQSNWLQSDMISFDELIKNDLEINQAEKEQIIRQSQFN